MDYNKKYTKKELINLHCSSFCNFQKNMDENKCKSNCLCPTFKIDHKNQIEQPKYNNNLSNM